ncbi:hypothetical protein [Bacillus sp. OK048]|uniref:hypothetical protein n=1 Tax=Bacillus sp. OK048 TaxID=1882761 RepID=UPI00088B8543|nr:hypothetical protein [Bacillus sp. OK048]SDN93058.1 hypothetical protein SAMN05443253_12810 [Bacillus sp. OK048]
MLSEMIESLLILLGGKDSQVTEEKTNQNLKLLRNEQWFRELFSKHTSLFLENREIRYVIGAVNLEKVLNSEKDKKKFQEVISILIDKKQR